MGGPAGASRPAAQLYFGVCEPGGGPTAHRRMGRPQKPGTTETIPSPVPDNAKSCPQQGVRLISPYQFNRDPVGLMLAPGRDQEAPLAKRAFPAAKGERHFQVGLVKITDAK